MNDMENQRASARESSPSCETHHQEPHFHTFTDLFTIPHPNELVRRHDIDGLLEAIQWKLGYWPERKLFREYWSSKAHSKACSMRLEAAKALGRLKDPRSVESLIRIMIENNKCWHAAYALGEIADPRALPHLLAILNDEKYRNMRDKILIALGKIGGPQAFDALIDSLGYPNSYQREKAVEALRIMNTPEAIDAVRDLERQKDGFSFIVRSVTGSGTSIMVAGNLVGPRPKTGVQVELAGNAEAGRGKVEDVTTLGESLARSMDSGANVVSVGRSDLTECALRISGIDASSVKKGDTIQSV